MRARALVDACQSPRRLVRACLSLAAPPPCRCVPAPSLPRASLPVGGYDEARRRVRSRPSAAQAEAVSRCERCRRQLRARSSIGARVLVARAPGQLGRRLFPDLCTYMMRLFFPILLTKGLLAPL